VTKNRVLAAAYAGAPRFGLEVFEPATTKTLMAALLVHDLYADGGPAQGHPWQDEAHAAAHGGMWRVPYAPRSALGLAALLGYRGAGKGSGLPDQRQAVVRVLGAAHGQAAQGRLDPRQRAGERVDHRLVGTHAHGLSPAPGPCQEP
jgi:hypothetical protein